MDENKEHDQYQPPTGLEIFIGAAVFITLVLLNWW